MRPVSTRHRCVELLLPLGSAFLAALFVVTAALDSTAAGAETEGGETNAPNHLIDETSPYLLLHAHNPVEWYPWGEAALNRARAEGKPIFLSVGYSTCYWCHVMERLVFSNREIADSMNQRFINIKVDREERPDLDKIYMLATQLISGQGGWPNSVFLTPELKPFFAGTYFPPTEAHGRPSFPRVLAALDAAWKNRRPEVLEAADQLTAAIRELESGQRAAPMDADRSLVVLARAAIGARYDARFGGFGGAPKFPSTMNLDFLLSSWVDTGDEAAWQMVEHSLEAMSAGGIYDQVGGGFHRYSTDAQWRVPHFEKMLYNQAALGLLYLRGFELSGRQPWRDLAIDILAFVKRELTAPAGPFYSALDAETESVEGKYYLWSEEELNTVLAAADQALFHELYDLAPVPETEGYTVFRRTDADAHRMDRRADESRRRVEAMRQQLLAARNKRVYPLRDDKIITSWNGMMIETYAHAYRLFQRPADLHSATAAADFILEHMRRSDGGLSRVYRNGIAKYAAFLEDYAFLARGLLSLYQATGDDRWLREGQSLIDQMLTRFWDDENGGFYFTEGGSDLIVRLKDGQDGALPAANAVAIDALLDLAQYSGDSSYLDKAAHCLRSFGGMMRAQPLSFTRMIAAADRYLKQASKQTAAIAPARVAPTPPDQVVQARIWVEPGDPVPGQEFDMRVDLSIAPGWHLNAYQPATATLRPTSMTLNSDLPLDILKISYPASEPVYIRALAETLRVYQGDVRLNSRLHLQPVAPVDRAGELRVLIQYQACDDTRCLPPGELQKAVSIRVGKPGS